MGGTSGVGTVFSNYHYYAELAIGATYTPPVKTIAMIQSTDFGSTNILTEFYDTAAWRECSIYKGPLFFAQDDDQNSRIKNTDAVLAFKMALTGVAWS